MDGDPLGDLSLSEQGIVDRDAIVFRHAFRRKIPLLMVRPPSLHAPLIHFHSPPQVLSGGYQRKTARVIARSILNLDDQFGLLTRPEADRHFLATGSKEGGKATSSKASSTKIPIRSSKGTTTSSSKRPPKEQILADSSGENES